MTVYFGKSKVYPIQVAEKGVCWLRARAHGKPGHGSMPHSDNPVYILAQAIEKLRRSGNLPVHLTPTFLRMLDAAGTQVKSPLGSFTRLLHSPALMSVLLKRMHGNSRNILRALVTNTVSPTILRAGSKVNVIPSVAEADIDCRMLPGQTPESAMHEIHRIVGEDIELEVMYTTGGAEFPTDSPFYKLLERRTRQLDPAGLVIPMLMPGATDACMYQNAGITMYGFTPGILPPEMPVLQMAHGHDERMPVSFIETGLPVLWDVVNEFCGGGS
ncbi:MAG: hypothetical protein A2136_05365 [Chloroflexi bacterium RBG_16_54_11]|nr:MAG: hypothetical protein A2136_05365 [Chloroflexi bacterium RBG_16_54_11]